jgi:tetratricopeptide (TPR) repeat protein
MLFTPTVTGIGGYISPRRHFVSSHRPQSHAPASPAQELLRRLAGPAETSALDALQSIGGEETELEGFRTLGECLEWRLADAYWSQSGLLPFVRNDVPYLVNNTGRLSESAAALVFAACEELGRALPERLVVLELGAGAGLHARYFLDAFEAQCRSEGRDYYDRLVYVVSDRFERTVARWRDDGIFADHGGHVFPALSDARDPAALRRLSGETIALPGPPLVVFCNYLLDVLPSIIARRAKTGFERLCVRTHLAGSAPIAAAGLRSLDEARALAASGRAEDLDRLLPLLPYLALETDYRPWTPADGAEQLLAEALPEAERSIVNADALGCLEKLLEISEPSGFLLINDYGPVRDADVSNHVGVQRFGGSVAQGLNFALLDRVLAARGLSVAVPEGDEQRRIRTRALGRRLGVHAREVFRARFSFEADRYLDAPQEEARQHLGAGRRAEALAAYQELVRRNPRDWQMLGEAAEYVGLQLRDHAAGLQIVRAALERNPWSSPWLWNILGDCLFYAEKLDEAHGAFMQASQIDPDDPRTNLNLAYTLSARGAHGEALAAIGRGLAHDPRGSYRPRLLEKQAQILSAVSERAAAEQAQLQRRAERFRP